MNIFCKTIVSMLNKNHFVDFPTRRRKLKSEIVIMARDGHLVIVHGPYISANLSLPLDKVQEEFNKYVETTIIPIVEYYSAGFRLASATLVMQCGGLLQLPDSFCFRGIEVVTGEDASEIQISLPEIGSLKI